MPIEEQLKLLNYKLDLYIQLQQVELDKLYNSIKLLQLEHNEIKLEHKEIKRILEILINKYNLYSIIL
jgi:hypothetical protein